MTDFGFLNRLMQQAERDDGESPLEALDRVSRFLRGETDDEIGGRRRYHRRTGEDVAKARKMERKR